MTDLIVVPQTTEWHRLKALVLDSVSPSLHRAEHGEPLAATRARQATINDECENGRRI